MNFVKKYKRTLLITVLFAIGAVYWSSCSGENNPASTDASGGNIVCKDGEAWIIDGTDGGYVFTSKGALITVAAISDGRWYSETAGTYSTSGSKLTMVTKRDGTKTVTYKVSGDKLTLSGNGDPVVFTKRTGVDVNL